MMNRLIACLLSFLIAGQLQAVINRNIVCVGTSLTVGHLSSDQATKAYPARMKIGGYLRNSTVQSFPVGDAAIGHSIGVGGRMVIGSLGAACTVQPTNSGTCLNTSGPAGCTQTMTSVALLSDCVDGLFVAGRSNVLVLECCTNDISGGGANPTQSRIITGLDAYVAARQAIGWKVVVVTVIARSWTGSAEPIRVAVNSHIAGMAGITIADASANVAFAAGVGAGSPAYDDLTYYNADKIHLSDTGYDLLGQIVAAAINTLPGGVIFPFPVGIR